MFYHRLTIISGLLSPPAHTLFVFPVLLVTPSSICLTSCHCCLTLPNLSTPFTANYALTLHYAKLSNSLSSAAHRLFCSVLLILFNHHIHISTYISSYSFTAIMVMNHTADTLQNTDLSRNLMCSLLGQLGRQILPLPLHVSITFHSPLA